MESLCLPMETDKHSFIIYNRRGFVNRKMIFFQRNFIPFYRSAHKRGFVGRGRRPCPAVRTSRLYNAPQNLAPRTGSAIPQGFVRNHHSKNGIQKAEGNPTDFSSGKAVFRQIGRFSKCVMDL